MATEDDPLSNEISVQAEITDTGLSVKTRSRFVSAVDRLGGNFVDWINLPFERSNARKRAVIAAEAEVIEAAKKQLIKRIKSDPEFAKRAITTHLDGVLRKQENKDEIVKIAFEELKRLPPPSTHEEVDSADTLDEDWLNHFETYAEQASTENMRKLFGLILSGKIRSPSAFSLVTLRVASELDQQTARLFEKYVSIRFGDIVPLPDVGDYFSECLELEAAGLISFGNGSLSRSFEPSNLTTFSMQGERYVARFQLHNQLQQLTVPAICLTRVGRELATIIPSDEIAAVKSICKSLGLDLVVATVHKITSAVGEPIAIDSDAVATIEGKPLQFG